MVYGLLLDNFMSKRNLYSLPSTRVWSQLLFAIPAMSSVSICVRERSVSFVTECTIRRKRQQPVAKALARKMSLNIRGKRVVLWRMIWAKSTYRNDSRRNPAVAGFLPIRELIRAVAGYRATALIRSLIGQSPAQAGFLQESLRYVLLAQIICHIVHLTCSLCEL